MLGLAAREADSVALGVAPNANEADVAERVDWLRKAAGARVDDLELNLNLMAVADKVPSFLSRQMGVTAEGLAKAGAISAIVGSPDQMCDALLERRERLGISYFMVADELMEALAPVVERLNGQ
jgi:alkanesulfonate monooxygenase SsuD/methylene tetrahydromethanopterin reductase-like flavin-dependent oxidoreductase (luciferase family)